MLGSVQSKDALVRSTNRDTFAQKAKQLDEAGKRIAFWRDWLEAITPLASGDERNILQEQARAQILKASDAIELLTKNEEARAERMRPHFRFQDAFGARVDERVGLQRLRIRGVKRNEALAHRHQLAFASLAALGRCRLIGSGAMLKLGARSSSSSSLFRWKASAIFCLRPHMERG